MKDDQDLWGLTGHLVCDNGITMAVSVSFYVLNNVVALSSIVTSG